MKKSCARRGSIPAATFTRNTYDCFSENISSYVRIKAKELIDSKHFPPDLLSDIQQDFALEIVRQMEKYNPEKSKEYTFVQRVIEHKIANMLKHKNALCRSGSTCLSFSDLKNEDINNVDLMTTDCIYSYGIKHDLQEITAVLPEELYDICTLLQSMSIADIVREVGLPRSTVLRRIKKIRKLFKEKYLDKYLKDVVISSRNLV